MELSNGFTTEKVGAVMVVRFVRPEFRNPLSVSVLDGLAALLADVRGDVTAVVFTGSDGIFASGADLREIAQVDGSAAREFAERGQRLMGMIAAMNVRTIAAVNGYCYGGALDLALACDSRIASPNAEFCHPGGGLGIMTGWGGTQRLPRLVGEAAALEIFLMGKKVNAENAVSIGLVDAIADDPLAAAIESCP